MNQLLFKNIAITSQEDHKTSFLGQSDVSQENTSNDLKIRYNNQSQIDLAYQNIFEVKEQTIQRLPNINSVDQCEDLNISTLGKSIPKIKRTRAVSQGEQSQFMNLSQILEHTNLDPRTKKFGFNVYKQKKSYAIPKKYIKKPKSTINSNEVNNTSQIDDIQLFQKPVKIYNHLERLLKQNIFNEFNPDLKKFKLDVQINQNNKDQSVQVEQQQPKLKMLDISQQVDLQNMELNQIMGQKNVFKQSIKDQKQSYIPDLQNQYIFRIVQGRRVQNEELEKLQTSSAHYWSIINDNINRLERLLNCIRAPLGIIDGRKIFKPTLKKVLSYFCKSMEKRITMNILLQAILNREDLEPKLSKYLKEKLFLGQNGQILQKAAIKIQKAFRGYRDRKKIFNQILFLRCVKKIQKFMRTQFLMNQTRKLIFERNHKRYEEFLKIQEEFKKNWDKYENHPVVEIHVVSASYSEYTRLTMEKFTQRENQIGRIFRANNPNITVIYITSHEMNEDLQKYYEKIFQLNEIDNFYQRVKILTPELYDKFPGHFSLLQTLLYSPKCLKKLKKLISGKKSFIVPSCCSNEYIQLATILKSPLYAGIPQKALVLSSKSGSKQLFQQCEIPVAPGITEIYEEQEMINSLTVLIVNNPEIRVWLFKMDDTFNSRGIATFSIDSVKGLFSIIKSQVSQLLAISVVKDLVQTSLPHKLNIIYKRLYSDYKEFMSAFLACGGIIEACPDKNLISKIPSSTIFFEIYPNGQINYQGSYEKIQGEPVTNIAYQFPQTQVQRFDIYMHTLGRCLYDQGIIGYISVDFIIFKKQKEMKFWAIGLDCYMNNQVSSYFYFDFLVGGQLNSTDLKYYLKQKNKSQERIFLFCPFITHPSLNFTHIQTFFHMCRLERISYDFEKKEGTSFLLPDMIQSGFLSLMTISTDLYQCVQLMNQFFAFIGRLAGNMNVNYGYSEIQSRSDIIQISDIYGKLKCLENIMTKKQIQK